MFKSTHYTSKVFFITFTGTFAGLALVLEFFNISLFLVFLKLDLSTIIVLFPFLIFSLYPALLSALLLGLVKNIVYMLINFGAGQIPGHIFQIIMTIVITFIVFLFLLLKMWKVQSLKNSKQLLPLTIKFLPLFFFAVILLSGLGLWLNHVLFLRWYLSEPGFFEKYWVEILAFNLIQYSIVMFGTFVLSLLQWDLMIKIRR